MGKDLNDRFYEVLKISKEIQKQMIEDLGGTVTNSTPYVQYVELYKQHSLRDVVNGMIELSESDCIYDGDEAPIWQKTWLQSAEEDNIINLEVDDTNTLVASSPGVNTLVADEVPQSIPVSNDSNINTLVS